MPTSVDRQQLRELIDRGATLVEVLEERQFGAAHLPGAVNIPGWGMTEERVADLDRSRPIVVSCVDHL